MEVCMNKQEAKTGNLTITLATFIYMLHDSGTHINDSSIKKICEKIAETIKKNRLQSAVPSIQDILQSYHLESSDASIKKFLNETYGDDIFANTDINNLGMELVDTIQKTLPSTSNIDDLYEWLQQRYDNIVKSWDSNERENLIANIRKHSFQSSLPWLAQIAERQGNELITHWVMVEKFTDNVICMDPYPWDDIDEEYELPLTDFMVRWELAGTNSIHCSL
jgi:hypothetical protein